MEKTRRGFSKESFKDVYNYECSLQESSVGNNIWLGVHENRMHLNQKLVKKLLPLLINYVETGELEKKSEFNTFKDYE